MNQTLSRRFAWSLLMVSLASTMLADPFPPGIKKSQVVTLDVASIERNANSSTPLVLDVGFAQLKVVLSPAPVWPKEGLIVTEVEKDGSQKDSVVTGNITYAGNVADEDPETNEVRLTIADGAIDGYVWSAAGYWFIAPLARFDPKAGAGQHLIYAAHDVNAVQAVDVALDEVCCYEVPPSTRVPLTLVLIADGDYLSESQTSFITRHATLMNNVNGIYHHQIGRTFIVVQSYKDPHNAFLESFDAGILKTELKQFVHHLAEKVLDAPPGSSDLTRLGALFAHLTTGKDVFFGSDGHAVAGLSDHNGRFGLSEQRGSDYLNKLLAAHELGHLFNAPDETPDYVCVNNDCGDTIMSGQWNGHIIPWFSDGLHGDAHNARKKIRDFMDANHF